MHRRSGWRCLFAALIALFAGSRLAASDHLAPPPPPPPVPRLQPDTPPDQTAKDDYIVTVLKAPADARDLPAALTLVNRDQLRARDPRSVRDAVAGTPNLLMQEFTARKLSFPYIRGVGSGPDNPSVTTTVDGVPVLHANGASTELFDLERIELVRGPQGALYGRNSQAGVLAIESAAPALDRGVATGNLTAGNFRLIDARAVLTQPLATDTVAVGVAGGIRRRDGFSRNRIGDKDVDSRDAVFGRAQAHWRPLDRWRTRLIVQGEVARDGDYALTDLAALRASPRRVSHDFEGRTRRNLLHSALLISREGQDVRFDSITGYRFWRTRDVTDLDTTATDLIVRGNEETMTQWTQEFRLASTRPLSLTADWRYRWLVGVFGFHADYGQDAYNSLSAAAAAGAGAPFPFQDISRAQLDDFGLSFFGQSGIGYREQWEALLGLRFDHEAKSAEFDASTAPALSAPSNQRFDRRFGRVSPQLTLLYRAAPAKLIYLTAASGYRAGGFNASAPAGAEPFDPESTWTIEWGAKTAWLDRRLTANLTLFYLHWQDLQLNIPNPSAPGRFYIDNAGDAISRGGELEITAKLWPALECFAGGGVVDARFLAGSQAAGTVVGGHFLPFAPAATWHAGLQARGAVHDDVMLFFRAETVGVGRYFYDASNKAQQTAYGLVNVRTGFDHRFWRMAVFADNLFDIHTVPLAIPYNTGFAPSGYVGESGAPATYGASLEIDL